MDKRIGSRNRQWNWWSSYLNEICIQHDKTANIWNDLLAILPESVLNGLDLLHRRLLVQYLFVRCQPSTSLLSETVKTVHPSCKLEPYLLTPTNVSVTSADNAPNNQRRFNPNVHFDSPLVNQSRWIYSKRTLDSVPLQESDLAVIPENPETGYGDNQSPISLVNDFALTSNYVHSPLASLSKKCSMCHFVKI